MSTLKLFQNTCRIESTRCPGWDYSLSGIYFVTVCTRSHHCYFGEIIDGEIFLNHAGAIVQKEITRTGQIREGVSIDSFVIMPNHIHLILFISQKSDVEPPRRGGSTESPNHWVPGSLGVIINHLKGACTRKIRADIDPEFSWQARFYDHVIRTEKDLDNLRGYIDNNPQNWQTKTSEACIHA